MTSKSDNHLRTTSEVMFEGDIHVYYTDNPDNPASNTEALLCDYCEAVRNALVEELSAELERRLGIGVGRIPGELERHVSAEPFAHVCEAHYHEACLHVYTRLRHLVA